MTKQNRICKTCGHISLCAILIVLSFNKVFGITISTPTTWNVSNPPPNPVTTDVNISSTLTIDGVTVNFSPGVGMYVTGSATGLSIMNGSVLRLDPGSTGTWAGITNQGDYTSILSNYVYNTTTMVWDINPSQSIVTIDGSTIKNADIAIYVFNEGIVRASNATFVDNAQSIFVDEHDAIVSGYYDANLNNVLAQKLPKSANIVKHCTFDHVIGGSFGHVRLWDIYFIEIAGNIFKNSAGTGGGTGIDASGASFTLHDQNVSSPDPITACVTFSGDRNVFTDLSQAVKATGSSERSDYTASLNHCSFVDCTVPISLNLGIHHTLGNNDITWEHVTADPKFVGYTGHTHLLTFVAISNSSNFLYYKNNITSDNIYEVMFQSDNNGTDQNLIELSTFSFNGNPSAFITGDIVMATQFLNENRNTNVKCNTFTKNILDISIDGTFNPQLGTSATGAHNIFSTTIPSYSYNINNSSGHLLTYYSTAPFNPSSVSTNVTIQISSGEDACPEIITCKKYWTGIKNPQQINIPVYLYPNPANNNVTINLGIELDYKIDRVEIIDIYGKTVRNIFVNASERNLEINTSGMATGVYIYSLILSDGTKGNGKFIIER
jgi:hypothetical protein